MKRSRYDRTRRWAARCTRLHAKGITWFRIKRDLIEQPDDPLWLSADLPDGVFWYLWSIWPRAACPVCGALLSYATVNQTDEHLHRVLLVSATEAEAAMNMLPGGLLLRWRAGQLPSDAALPRKSPMNGYALPGLAYGDDLRPWVALSPDELAAAAMPTPPPVVFLTGADLQSLLADTAPLDV